MWGDWDDGRNHDVRVEGKSFTKEVSEKGFVVLSSSLSSERDVVEGALFL